MTKEIKSVDGLIAAYKCAHPNGHYFDHDTLKFFGERISDMRLLKNRKTVTDTSGEKHDCYVLSSLQRKCWTGPKRNYAYFDVETLDDVIQN